MSDNSLVILVASIILLHFIVGFGWVFWKMRKKKEE
jgi:flagellar basal body-associated protein FliL